MPAHLMRLTIFDASHFEYFRTVFAKEFALFFKNQSWTQTLLHYAYMEPSICHAALSISSRNRDDYFPMLTWDDPGHTKSVAEYSLLQYGLAIQHLNSRLDTSIASLELATFASILFAYIEGLQNTISSVQVHLRGGLALAQSLKQHSPDGDLFESDLWQILEQVQQIETVYRRSKMNPPAHS
jgi:hypothetical protein